MLKQLKTTLWGTALALFIAPAWGLNADQVRGEVVSADEDARELTIEILNSGEDRAGEVGTVKAYTVPAGTPIEFEIDRRIYTFGYDIENDSSLADVTPGDVVVIDFEEVAGRNETRKLRSERTSNTEVRDRVRREGRLAANAQPESDSLGTDDALNETYIASADASSRSSLPDTASALPLIAMGGTFFVLGALVIRTVRRLRS